MLDSTGEEGVGDHDGKYPDRDTHTFGHTGAPPPTGCFNLHYGEVTVDTYAGQEQDAAVHVDKVA